MLSKKREKQWRKPKLAPPGGSTSSFEEKKSHATQTLILEEAKDMATARATLHCFTLSPNYPYISLYASFKKAVTKMIGTLKKGLKRSQQGYLALSLSLKRPQERIAKT